MPKHMATGWNLFGVMWTRGTMWYRLRFVLVTNWNGGFLTYFLLNSWCWWRIRNQTSVWLLPWSGIHVQSCRKALIWGFLLVFSVCIRVPVDKSSVSSCPNIWLHAAICLESNGDVVPCGTGWGSSWSYRKFCIVFCKFKMTKL